jgi:L-lactate dehydrogenase complex protein LldG
MSSAREQILGKIKQALKEHQVAMPFPEAEKEQEIFAPQDVSIEEKFAAEFSKLGGKFVYCSSEHECVAQLQALKDNLKWNTFHVKDSYLIGLFRDHHISPINTTPAMEGIEVGVSLTECLVARTGSVIMSAAQEHGRALPVFSPIHIVVAFANQLVWNISDAIAFMNTKYNNQLPSMISLTTGPSRTADIEKTLVVGVHGPKEVYVFFIDNVPNQSPA